MRDPRVVLKIVVCSFWILCILLLAVGIVRAGDLQFSWDPNVEAALTGYEIYCDTKSHADGSGGHPLYKVVAKDSIVDGRVHYTWQDFPVGEYYCVAVALGEVNGKVLTSKYSDEVKAVSGFSPPEAVKVVVVEVKVTLQ